MNISILTSTQNINNPSVKHANPTWQGPKIQAYAEALIHLPIQNYLEDYTTLEIFLIKRKTIITLMKLIKELINNINMFYDLYIDLPLRYFELINDTIFKEINLSELVYRIKAYEDKNVINYLFISNILETVTNNNIES
ncbi:hypothetical protein LY90DRAFT_515727 [Neocallimastix californiae]|uniref:Uncharacterized protein n=1 Tax=Neocallimastix californiae TaxID=1754190 RepID=A0A1Y2AHW1_9FUNG|nr:hypothetical protein LY90DRAFT_515727 [Neocallimastix californiae]|eukprot:ORY22096.1 hypothetical protein LY90DRAFT_515727 [Neocallimastix californiae]